MKTTMITLIPRSRVRIAPVIETPNKSHAFNGYWGVQIGTLASGRIVCKFVDENNEMRVLSFAKENIS